MYGSTLLKRFTEALLILTNEPLCNCLNLNNLKILTLLGLSLLTPRILTMNANFDSAGTKIWPVSLAWNNNKITCLLALISAFFAAWYCASYWWALCVIYCLRVLLDALLAYLCCWRAVAIFWSLYYFFLSPSGLGTTTFYPAITTKINIKVIIINYYLLFKFIKM